LGVIIVDEIYPKRHFFCTRPMYPYQFASLPRALGMGILLVVRTWREP
jgi:hypothetical protein